MVGVSPTKVTTVKVTGTMPKTTPMSQAEQLDVKFRKIYPVAYGLFNFIYWGYYLGK